MNTIWRKFVLIFNLKPLNNFIMYGGVLDFISYFFEAYASM
jgi:hypothetical protein